MFSTMCALKMVRISCFCTISWSEPFSKNNAIYSPLHRTLPKSSLEMHWLGFMKWVCRYIVYIVSQSADPNHFKFSNATYKNRTIFHNMEPLADVKHLNFCMSRWINKSHIKHICHNRGRAGGMFNISIWKKKEEYTIGY